MTKSDKVELPEKMDRKIISYGNQKIFDEEDRIYWQNAPVEEKIQTITYLRECFYGEGATTGKIENTYIMFKLE